MSNKPWVTDPQDYVEETIWRLTPEDIEVVCKDNFPELSSKQIEQLVDIAHDKLEIHDWVEAVIAFVDVYKDDLED